MNAAVALLASGRADARVSKAGKSPFHQYVKRSFTEVIGM
jgi:hypothetical protein